MLYRCYYQCFKYYTMLHAMLYNFFSSPMSWCTIVYTVYTPLSAWSSLSAPVFLPLHVFLLSPATGITQFVDHVCTVCTMSAPYLLLHVPPPFRFTNSCQPLSICLSLYIPVLFLAFMVNTAHAHAEAPLCLRA
jgi:hypothetical protein